MPENQNETTNVLVGYVRKSNAGGALKVSINTDAFSDCSTYVTSDGQAYVPLVISLNALEKVLNGEREDDDDCNERQRCRSTLVK